MNKLNVLQKSVTEIKQKCMVIDEDQWFNDSILSTTVSYISNPWKCRSSLKQVMFIHTHTLNDTHTQSL